ncbi:MmpS family transport accessory protein [Nocardia arthritidis]|uniref:non-specific serine/threonine protein kinase n=1 Tax=Nocardia arthritidis TaxID=228602 RepID=A0A6G9Y941_9NOCA|nr:MmpS family transport accessory protein [Nocardia arthritidis]QIS09731.1 protein kinase [Nocardia arthritidis]
MAELRTGEVFAGYQVQEILGRGGMGTVYLAQHPRLPRLTALKVLDAALFTNAEIRARFEREANVVARLEHPNIVAIHDRGIDGESMWIAMQYVAGGDAASIGIVDPRRAVRIIAETANALDYAHRRGVLHRDVKPANILLANRESGEPERALLADFGIARLRDEVGGLTRTGTFTATLAFAAPEQLAGGSVDHRCDQYSLACTLFALLAGSAPFAATNPVAVIEAHMRQPPPPLSSRRGDMPPALDAVLSRALAKHPDNRYGSCSEFAAAAGEALLASAAPPPAPPTVAQQWAPPSPGLPSHGHQYLMPMPQANLRPSLQPSMQAPAPSYRASGVRRPMRRWLLGGLAVLVVLAAGVGVAIVVNQPKLGPSTTYEILGNAGGPVTVSYRDQSGTHRVANISLPWQLTVRVPEGQEYWVKGETATQLGLNHDLHCRIVRDGQELHAESAPSYQNAIDCSV